MANSGLPCFIIGFGLGTALGLLTAPRAGRETRDGLRKGAEEGREIVIQKAGEFVGYAEEVLENGRRAAESQRGQLQGAFDAGVRAYRDALGNRQ